MVNVKIISNPYKKQVQFQRFFENGSEWRHIDFTNNPSSKLLRKEIAEGFFPFRAKLIIETIADEYGIPGEPITIQFEGTADEFDELRGVCSDDSYAVPIIVKRSPIGLANARDILPEVKKLFQQMIPLIDQCVDQAKIQHDMSRFSDASSDVVPICVLGNYSTGKSTFINALIGSEILPSGAEPVTAKVYKISRSKYRDRALIKCKYLNWGITITFTDKETIIDDGNVDNPLTTELKRVLFAMDGEDIVLRVNRALSIVNDIENKTEELEISDLIEVEIPFANGVLAQSLHPFVIFDTPGSNSVSNVKHLRVLKEAMANMTNGLPIFLSTPDALDSTDNENLYQIIRELEELDNRFTMIVVNKADSAGIQRRDVSQLEQNRILSQAVPRNLYSGGLFYVSSILGLGAKTGGSFFDYVYEDIFDAQVSRYSDPNNKHYRSLYLFNIMPEQIKRRSDMLAAEQSDLVYANSGLFSIETEIETFAGKYAAYNKCFQSQLFLRRVISITKNEIESKKTNAEEIRKTIRDKLEEDKRELIDRLASEASRAVKRFDDDYNEYMSEYLAQTKGVYSEEELKKKEASFIKEQEGKQAYSENEQAVREARACVAENLRSNVRQVFVKRKLNLSAVKAAAQELAADVETVVVKARTQRDVRKDVDRAAADDLIGHVSYVFEEKQSEFIGLLDEQSKAYWTSSTESIRSLLVGIVSGSEVLTDDRRRELERIIITYKTISFDDRPDKELFRRGDFLRRISLGRFVIWESDHLDISKLVNACESNMADIIGTRYRAIEESHKDSAHNWTESLLNEIYTNIVEYSPELSKKAKQIQSLTEDIETLLSRSRQLEAYSEELKAMMDWKEM